MLVLLRQKMAVLLRDPRAVTAIEYGMIAAFLSILVLTGATLIGSQLKAVFVKVSAGL